MKNFKLQLEQGIAMLPDILDHEVLKKCKFCETIFDFK